MPRVVSAGRSPVACELKAPNWSRHDAASISSSQWLTSSVLPPSLPDLSRPEDVMRLTEVAAIDVLIANAGIHASGDARDLAVTSIELPSHSSETACARTLARQLAPSSNREQSASLSSASVGAMVSVDHGASHPCGFRVNVGRKLTLFVDTGSDDTDISHEHPGSGSPRDPARYRLNGCCTSPTAGQLSH